MSIIYRQGDILLIQQDSLPARARSTGHKSARVVLAYGEATGHAHALDARHAVLYEIGENRFIQTVAGATLSHAEHAPIELAPGVYKIVQQREFTPREVRYVRD